MEVFYSVDITSGRDVESARNCRLTCFVAMVSLGRLGFEWGGLNQ